MWSGKDKQQEEGRKEGSTKDFNVSAVRPFILFT
jgi:hypothetical protein